jgi:prephenate dehydrogenase
MKAQTAHWPSVAIVGVGLIGGSVGRALRARRLADRVIGIGRSRESLAAARATGAVTEIALDPAAVAEADLVVVATGVRAIPRLLEAVDAEVRPGTPITDAGSTKASIVAAWEKRRKIRRGRFVGSPAAATPTNDVEDIGGLWSALGATVFVMNPREHDRLVAATSHAPHVLAAALAAATPPAAIPFTAGGWRDTTRIASGDPELWAEILLDNAGPLTAALKRVATAAERMIAAIEAGDRRRLVTLLSRAKDVRDALGS